MRVFKFLSHYYTNLRTGIFSPESSFWSRQTLNNAAEKRNDTLTEATFTTDTLAKAKMKHMDISADLTLKFMGKAYGQSKVQGLLQSERMEAPASTLQKNQCA